MATKTPLPIPCGQLLQEHAAVCELLTTLYRAFAERHEPAHRLISLLSALKERVEAHLQDEETSDMFGDLRRRAPHRSDYIERLEAEHAEMRDKLRGLLKLVETSTLDSATWDAAEHQFRDFSNQLTHHEAAENDLVQRVYDEDLGAHD